MTPLEKYGSKRTHGWRVREIAAGAPYTYANNVVLDRTGGRIYGISQWAAKPVAIQWNSMAAKYIMMGGGT